MPGVYLAANPMPKLLDLFPVPKPALGRWHAGGTAGRSDGFHRASFPLPYFSLIFDSISHMMTKGQIIETLGAVMGGSERKARLLRLREREIIRAMDSLVDRQDWRTVTIDEIAREADIGKGTIYLHFARKEEILARLVIHHYKRFLGLVATIPLDDPLARLHAVVAAALQFRQEQGERLGLIQYCQQPRTWRSLGTAFREEFVGIFQAMDAVMESVLQACHTAGLCPAPPTRRMIRCAWEAILGPAAPNYALLEAHRSGDNLTEEIADVDYLTDFVLGGWRSGKTGVSRG